MTHARENGWKSSGDGKSSEVERVFLTDGEEVVVDEMNKNYHVKAKVGIPKEKVEDALAQGGLSKNIS